MKNKALSLTTIMAFGFLIVLGAIITLGFKSYTTYLDMKIFVKVSEDEREKITLAQVLLSSDMLTYSDENKVHRGVFDKTKLDNLKQEELFKEIGYPDKEYFVKIEERETGNVWKYGKQPLIYREKRNYPVAIRYSQSDVHTGLMYVGWS